MKTRKNYIMDNYEILQLIKRAASNKEIAPYEWSRASRNWGYLKDEKTFLKRFFIYFNWEEILSNYRSLEHSLEYNEIFRLIFNDDPIDEEDQLGILNTYKLPIYNYMSIDRQQSIDAYYYCRNTIQKLFCEHNLPEYMFDYIMSNKKILSNGLVREALIQSKILFPDKRSLEMLKIICKQNTYQIEQFDMYQPRMLNTIVCKFFKEFNLEEIYKLLYHTHNLTPETKGLLRSWRRVLNERMKR